MLCDGQVFYFYVGTNEQSDIHCIIVGKIKQFTSLVDLADEAEAEKLSETEFTHTC